MKSRFLLLLGCFCVWTHCFAAGDSAGQVAATTPIGILPAFKRGKVVDPGERNPFGKAAVEVQEAVATGAEAAKLSAILESLPVSGVIRSDGGELRSVLLGDLVLQPGEMVPQLVEGQTDQLVVQSLTATEIVIAWRMEAGRKVSEPRLLRRKIDLEPKVQVMLPGQIGMTKGPGASQRKAVMIAPGRKDSTPPGILPTAGLPASRAK